VTYTLIQTQTLASTASTITFSSIPQTYTDLLLVFSEATSRANAIDQININFNGVTTSTYTSRVLYGTGTGQGGETLTTTFMYCYANGGSQTANTFGSIQAYISNYASTTANKSASIEAVSENNASSGGWQNIVAGSWASTAAITSIALTPLNGPNWNVGCTASLYGIN